jgi:hypothetical protein
LINGKRSKRTGATIQFQKRGKIPGDNTWLLSELKSTEDLLYIEAVQISISLRDIYEGISF